MQRDGLRFDVGQDPGTGSSLALALTHVMLIFDGIIFIPNVLGKSAGVSAGTLEYVTFAILLVAAASTWLQSRRFLGIGSGFILFSGSYSAFLLCSLDAMRLGGFPLLATMSLSTVPLIFLYTYFIRHLRHIITPAVGGVVILLIALSMVPIGLDIWAGSGPEAAAAMPARVAIGVISILTLTILMLFGSTLIKMWSPLIAMGCGYGASALFGQLEFTNAANAAWVGLPPLSAWPGLDFDLGQAHIPLLLAFAMAMLASVIESTGNIMLVQQISTRNFRRVDYDRVQSGLYCDGLAKIAAGLLGTAVPSTYCDNLPLIEMTGVASRRIGAYGAGILLVLAFLPKVSGVILDMPGPVIGGFLIVVAAMLFHAGIGLVTMTRLNNQNGLILGLSLTAGLVAQSGPHFPGLVPESLAPLLGNSVAVGGFTAFFLSTLAYLTPKLGIQRTFKASCDEASAMMEFLEQGRNRLKLTPDRFNALSLCCEEMLCHVVNQTPNGEGRKVTLRVARAEEGWFAEMVCGHQMDDINNFAVPESLLLADEDDLRQLGLALFARFARDVKHLEISGYTYISFLI